MAQNELREILLLHEDEDQADVIPPLGLQEFKDNPANVTPG
jgi:hypothetical protein